jgi:hypothetical protein
MLDPEDVPAFIEHCKEVYGRVLNEQEASDVLNRLLDLYTLVCQPLPSERQRAPAQASVLPLTAPERSSSTPGISDPDSLTLF